MTAAEIERFPFPLNRFYLKPRLWMTEAWEFSPDHHPDALLGVFYTRDAALKCIQATEDYERELYGIWRFFAE